MTFGRSFQSRVERRRSVAFSFFANRRHVLSFIEKIIKFGRLAAKYGPEVYELVELAIKLYGEFGPKATELFQRILDDVNGAEVSILSADSLEGEYSELAAFCNKPAEGEVTTAARGDLFRGLIDFIKKNPELITIIIGLFGKDDANG